MTRLDSALAGFAVSLLLWVGHTYLVQSIAAREAVVEREIKQAVRDSRVELLNARTGDKMACVVMVRDKGKKK